MLLILSHQGNASQNPLGNNIVRREALKWGKIIEMNMLIQNWYSPYITSLNKTTKGRKPDKKNGQRTGTSNSRTKTDFGISLDYMRSEKQGGGGGGVSPAGQADVTLAPF